MTTAYKAVIEDNGRFFSVFASGKWRLEYKIGEKTKPTYPNSKIFLYATLSGALSESGTVLVGEADNLVHVKGTKIDLDEDQFAHIWDTGKAVSPAWCGRTAECGFCWSDSFTPRQIVDKEITLCQTPKTFTS
jgi:hypothetical protein